MHGSHVHGVCGVSLCFLAQLRDMNVGGVRRIGIIVTDASEWIFVFPEDYIPCIRLATNLRVCDLSHGG